MADDNAPFLALKNELPRRKHIAWDEVYRLHSQSFADHPVGTAQVVEAFRWLEQRPEGQKLFRDITAHPKRIAPVSVTTNSRGGGFTYDGEFDTININPSDLNDPKQLRIYADRMRISSYKIQDVLRIIIAHESDHAVHVFSGLNVPPNSRSIKCIEALAVEREQPFRKSLGLPLRPGYLDHIAEIRAGTFPPSEVRNERFIALRMADFNAGCEVKSDKQLKDAADAIGSKTANEMSRYRESYGNPLPDEKSGTTAGVKTIVPQTTTPVPAKRSGPAM